MILIAPLLLATLSRAADPASAPGSAAAPASLAAPTAAAAPPRISLNGASVADLAAIDAVGESNAEAIVALRAKRGHLDNIEELRVIPGLGDDALSSLRARTQIEIDAPTGVHKTYDTADQVLAEFANEPGINQVQAWANEYAQTSPETVQRWLRQSKSAAALPSLDLDGDFGRGYDSGYNYYVISGLPEPTSPDDPLFPALDDAGTNEDWGFKVGLGWDLDELVMSSNRIRVISEVQDIVKLRDKVLSEATRLYFERRRLQVDILLNPKSELGAQIKDQLKLLEMTANLDAYTGGKFSQGISAAGSPTPAQ
jgi:competence ComEA-like helix-hairpin-helix protein